MRKLLLLLPALALASCSGGHDLMSNKPFRTTREAPASDREGTFTTTLLVSPDMPQATLLREGAEMPEITYELAVKTPVRFELRRPAEAGMSHVISINRETGELSHGYRDYSGFNDIETAGLKCRFETL